jgi:3-oxoadipate enol-lactonase
MASSELLYFTERGWGPPLLLVHGLMFTGEMFKPVVEHFATRHRVIPDLRGHGRSRGLAPPYTAAQLASDLSRLLDHLGIDSTAVLGHSHGGAIAQQLVLGPPHAMQPPRARKHLRLQHGDISREARRPPPPASPRRRG